MNLALIPRTGRALNILCLGAHSDDIEIGCGGTILRLIKDLRNVTFCWVVFSSGTARKQEAKNSAYAFLRRIKQKSVIVEGFRDGFFPYVGGEIKEFFEELKRKVSPDLIFTHYRFDLHQDHRLLSELTWNTFRDHTILEYEIPKYDGDLGSPNVFFHLSKSICVRKVSYLLKYFPSQRENHWFNQETFQSLLLLRGVESNAPEKYAEAFYSRKMLF